MTEPTPGRDAAHPDAALLALCARHRKLQDEYEAALKRQRHLVEPDLTEADAVVEYQCPVYEDILNTRARTVAGLLAKALVACDQSGVGDAIRRMDQPELDAEGRMLGSILRDLEAGLTASALATHDARWRPAR